uniref:Immunoglobulin V-set domain-containing protein n=1 Tax=Salmo trutta TaxID=8032 RepID=A0A674DEE2_SALTR
QYCTFLYPSTLFYCIAVVLNTEMYCITQSQICPYDRGFETYQKYLSKGIWAYQVDVIQTKMHQHPAWTHKGRFSLYDDTKRRVFTVIIRQLTRQDEGTYWCGVDKPTIPDSYTEVELDVKEATYVITWSVPLVNEVSL